MKEIDEFRKNVFEEISSSERSEIAELLIQIDTIKANKSEWSLYRFNKIIKEMEMLPSGMWQASTTLSKQKEKNLMKNLLSCYLTATSLNRAVTIDDALAWNQLIAPGECGLRVSIKNDQRYLSARYVQKEIECWFEFYNSEEIDDHPLVRGARLYRYFMSIHPFEDGNGRTGRLLIDRYLLLNGYPPAQYQNVTDNYVAYSTKGVSTEFAHALYSFLYGVMRGLEGNF